MDLRLSDRVNAIKPSPTIAVSMLAAELRAQGRDVIGLGAGEPDFDTPDHIKQAAHEAISSGFTKYTAVDGTGELKAAIIEKFRRENGLEYTADQVLVSSGGKQCIFNLAQALINPGDEVVIPAPYWVSYPDIALLSGGVPVAVPAGTQQRYKITAEQLDAALTDKARLLILNSPSNPSGMAYTKAELGELGEVLERYPNVMIATDDMYEHIMWSDEPFHNILNACPGLYDRTIVLNGVSKAYAMTGWRIGYAAGPKVLLQAMKKVQSQSTSNPNSVAQVAAQAALAGDQSCITPMLEAFRRRHDLVVAGLNGIAGIEAHPGDGTFYAFPDVSEAIARLNSVNDDVEFGSYLIDKAGVALVPGSAFGSPGHMRLSFATSDENLNKAIDRMGDLLGTA
ncbi:MAG: pyridoxal phosphate-dependent aminotransferase [Gammaproteobacteria bacterium]|nr:pyridoxal phosphate-dependent aminotransferase [Gammaproteobacteria bacterium]